MAIGSLVSLGIRPEWIELKAEPCDTPNSFLGNVEGRTFLGDAVIYWVRVGRVRLMVKTTSSDFSVGGQITVVMPVECLTVFSDEDGGLK